MICQYLYEQILLILKQRLKWKESQWWLIKRTPTKWWSYLFRYFNWTLSTTSFFTTLSMKNNFHGPNRDIKNAAHTHILSLSQYINRKDHKVVKSWCFIYIVYNFLKILLRRSLIFDVEVSTYNRHVFAVLDLQIPE